MSTEAAVRDSLTVERLTAAAAHLRDFEVLDFDRDWWDGMVHEPCLIVRGGRKRRRQRIVETDGECVILPFAQRDAERWLADRRRPRRVELTVPAQRSPEDVVVDASEDAVRCETPSCGALLPLRHEGDCPVCGG